MAEPQYRFGGPTPEAVKALRARRLARSNVGSSPSSDVGPWLLEQRIPVSIPYLLSRPFFEEDAKARISGRIDQP